MDIGQVGRRLRALRLAQGRTAASVAADAGLSVPYVANLENGRGNPTVDALGRIAHALGTRCAVEFDGESAADAVPVPASLARFGRSTRYRRDIRLIAESTGADADELAARVLDALARLAGVLGRDLAEPDWVRLLDAVVLVSMHPQPKK